MHSYVLDIEENDCNLLFFFKPHFNLDFFLNIAYFCTRRFRDIMPYARRRTSRKKF